MLRLYLDTADLIDIADGNLDVSTIGALHKAMTETGTTLVITVNHLWDFYYRSDVPTRERMIDAINAFPAVAVVLVEPLAFERKPSSSTDLRLLECPDIRDVLDEPETLEALRVLDAVPPLAREAEQAGAEAQRASLGKRPKKTDIEKSVRLAVTLARRGHVLDGDDLAAFWEENTGQVLTAEVRTAVIGMRQLVVSLMQMDPELDEDRMVDLVLGNVDRDFAQYAPGSFVRRALGDARRQNYTRNSKESDVVDLQHVQYLPYVDALTTDRENVGVLAPAVGRARKIRAARLLRNGRLNEIPAILRELARSPAGG